MDVVDDDDGASGGVESEAKADVAVKRWQRRQPLLQQQQQLLKLLFECWLVFWALSLELLR